MDVRGPAMPSEALDAISTIVAAAMQEQQIPGVSLVVMRGDEIMLARGFGREDAWREDPVSETTVFALGSISKQFVAAVVLQLVEEGRLTLADPVADHLPDFTQLPPGLAIHHLLSHTSGMRDEFLQPELVEIFNRPGSTFEEYLAVARHTPAHFAPGSRWSYSNVNYLMLTVILERLTGAALETVVKERCTGPLGLLSLRLCPLPPEQTPGHARGHLLRDEGFAPHPPENIQLFHGSGGYCGNAVDLARWTRALVAAKVVSAQSYRQMTTRALLDNGRQANYGFAMDLGVPDGVQRHGHGGYGGGFSAQAAYYPAAELTVVVLTNRFVFPERIERKISRLLLGLPTPVLREAGLSADERRRYVGSYDIGVGRWQVRILDRDERLWFELPGPSFSMPLMYLGNNEFVSDADPDGYRLCFSGEESNLELKLLGMGLMTWYGVRCP